MPSKIRRTSRSKSRTLPAPRAELLPERVRQAWNVAFTKALAQYGQKSRAERIAWAAIDDALSGAKAQAQATQGQGPAPRNLRVLKTGTELRRGRKRAA